MPDNSTSLSFEKEKHHQENGGDTLYCPRFNNNPNDTYLLMKSNSCLFNEVRMSQQNKLSTGEKRERQKDLIKM